VSRDGTCRLWDCGTQQQLAIVADAGAAINQSAIASGSGDQSDGGGVERSVKKKGSSTVRVSFLGNSYWGPSVGSLSPYTVFSMNGWKMRCYPRAGDREVGTEGKVVALACEDRSARLVDLYSRRQVRDERAFLAAEKTLRLVCYTAVYCSREGGGGSALLSFLHRGRKCTSDRHRRGLCYKARQPTIFYKNCYDA
jgi:hypothetical protein